MTTLVTVDGSESSLSALRFVAQKRPGDHLILLHVARSGRLGDLERGRFLLASGCQELARFADTVPVETWLRVGRTDDVVNEVAADAGCDLIVLGAHGVNALPHMEAVSEASTLTAQHARLPVVLVQPDGSAVPHTSGPPEGDTLSRERALWEVGAAAGRAA